MPSELLPDWAEVVDTSSGEKYYYHKLTKETTWDRPCRGSVKDTPKQPEPQPAVVTPAKVYDAYRPAIPIESNLM